MYVYVRKSHVGEDRFPIILPVVPLQALHVLMGLYLYFLLHPVLLIKCCKFNINTCTLLQYVDIAGKF